MAIIRAEIGSKGTCRYCDQPVVLKKVERGSHYFWGPTWVHIAPDDPADCDEKFWKEYSTYRRAEPKEWCTEVKNDGYKCYRPVKHEDLTAEIYGCGVHNRGATSERERREYNRKRMEEEKTREEVAQWEASVYQDAENTLRMWLGDELFDEGHHRGQHAVQDRHGRHMYVDHTVVVDWFKLVEAISLHVAKELERATTTASSDS